MSLGANKHFKKCAYEKIYIQWNALMGNKHFMECIYEQINILRNEPTNK